MTKSFLELLGGFGLLFWVGVASADPVDTARVRTASDDPVNCVTFGHDYSNQR